MTLHQRIHGAKLRFHSQRCSPDSDERARSCDLLREVALKIRAARLGFVSSGRIETARDKRAIRRDQPGSVTALFCLDLLRPEPHGTKAVRPTSAAKNAEQG